MRILLEADKKTKDRVKYYGGVLGGAAGTAGANILHNDLKVGRRALSTAKEVRWKYMNQARAAKHSLGKIINDVNGNDPSGIYNDVYKKHPQIGVDNINRAKNEVSGAVAGARDFNKRVLLPLVKTNKSIKNKRNVVIGMGAASLGYAGKKLHDLRKNQGK
jgi:hypothetical protein